MLYFRLRDPRIPVKSTSSAFAVSSDWRENIFWPVGILPLSSVIWVYRENAQKKYEEEIL
jgi:hypothetical protein